MQSLRFALQPAVMDISVTWDVPKSISVTVLSLLLTTAFQGQRSLIYAQLTGEVGAATTHHSCLIFCHHSTINYSSLISIPFQYNITVINFFFHFFFQSSEAAEGCVTVKYSLAGHLSENQLHFRLKPAEDTG